MNRFLWLAGLGFIFILSLTALTDICVAQGNLVKSTDRNHDGLIDTWTTYDSKGNAVTVALDSKRKDGKPDYWKYYHKGKIHKREWDRNFDGLPDLRVIEENTRVIETQYDYNYDGQFDKKVKAPKKGSILSVKTTNE